MQRLVHVAGDDSRSVRDPSELDTLLATGDGWLWLDIVAPTEADLDEVARRFELDRVGRDDLFESQFPKLERLDRMWVLVLHALAPDPMAIRTVELDMLIGFGWIVTLHDEPVASLDEIHERIDESSFTVKDARHLGARITEFVGERYLPILDDLDAQILDLEDEAVEGDPGVLPDIHALRRDVAVLRRVLGPQRRMLEVLERSDHGLAPEQARDISDASTTTSASWSRSTAPTRWWHGPRHLPRCGRRADERGDEGPHRVLCHLHAADARRRHLRHELPVMPELRSRGRTGPCSSAWR